jgi:hypothetical protein
VDIAKFSTFFRFPCHISHPNVCISHDQHFQLSCHIPGLTVCIYQFSSFSIFLNIFHYLTSVILIFREFQFSHHIPGPTVCMSHFSRFSVISSFFKSSSGCFSFSMIFCFLAIFHVLQWTFLNFPPFSGFLAIFHVLKCVFLIFLDFHFLAIFQVLLCAFIIFHFLMRFLLYLTSYSVCFSFPWFSVFSPYSTPIVYF